MEAGASSVGMASVIHHGVNLLPLSAMTAAEC
jgi:hypothetical protein